jgi:hypothetical protein
VISIPPQRNMPIAQPRKEKGSCAQVPVIVTGDPITIVDRARNYAWHLG